MKKIHFIISFFVLTILLGCSGDDSSTIDLDGISAPANITTLTTVTQDNSGKVTFLPKGEGVTQYKIKYGDGSESDYFSSGTTATHAYKEGVYQSKIIAMGINGKTTEITQQVLVSFKAPENLKVVIASDPAIAKKVTVKATADFALFYDVYFGEAGKPDPVSANNGESISYVYQQPGVYTIRVVSKSAAIKTTEYTEQYTAKLILEPTASAPTPPTRPAGNVISIFSSKYTDLAGTDFFPNWGQSGTYKEFNLSGDKILNYSNLNYQGIALADKVTIDVSGMEYLHMDVWTADLEKIKTFLISKTNGEKAVTTDLTANQWTSIDIPISAFTSQGLTVADIFQLKLEGNPSGKSVFIDNIYFYKQAAEAVALPLDFESPNLTFAWGGFGNIDASVVTNPYKTGVNVSDKVVKLDKKAGAETWGGASLNLDNTPDFAKGTKVQVNVWAPKAGVDILYKMELSTSPKDGNGNPTVFLEVKVKTTVANAWNVLTFDLTTAPGFSTSIKYDRVILFPDFGTAGAGDIYYFDDIKQSN
ncbi:hypothetical protein BC749_102302 [Flavobacterium araucananum]|uniref:PKD domain-containing protein n=1 Tax=Flavobacterium araucananum TaxID=946678 RepID=A0A227NYL5_9FLAO|nr:hypothetical protein [Flavobacterium araucananum]OXG02739.1 hypothetical protein B0A64_18180 [Flavobacterium araucananum]PWK00737.1 hypothetical protein BC749_102302 [Flavobacterium araucananum]